MNLHDLLEKQNRNIAASQGVRAGRAKLEGDPILGVIFPKRERATIEIMGASEFPHIAAGVDDLGWGAQLLGSGSGTLTISFRSSGDFVSRRYLVTSAGYSRLFLPSMLDLKNPFDRADLVLETDAPNSDLFLATSRRVPREALYRLARGTGVEIGPGPRPQIHNGPDTQVSYIEEMPAEEWTALYKADVSREAWEKQGYRIGKAHDLPVEDGSLDFIFSSHVFEHLYNPLGHLEHWRSKLKPGGLVLAIVPGIDGTKDFVLPPSNILNLLEEHRVGGFEPQIEDYQKWVRAHQPHHSDIAAVAQQYRDARFSIHVHVYDYITINTLLRHSVGALGYSAYRIHYRKNSKDFAFALKA